MIPVKAIIVDDERLARSNMRKLLESYPYINIVGEASSCAQASELAENFNPGLIFLDIQLKGETGFDLLDKINKSAKIIFVTAYDEFAIRAFEINALDYLLKPVNPERLKLSLERIFENRDSHAGKSERNEEKVYEYFDSIYVKINNFSSKFVKISNISYIEPAGNYSKIVSNDGRYCLVQKTMKEWEEELPGRYFIRIHRSAIINIEHIDRIEVVSGNQHRVFLKSLEMPLGISRRYVKKIRTAHHIL
jgi:two-component system LytT family response regulator